MQTLLKQYGGRFRVVAVRQSPRRLDYVVRDSTTKKNVAAISMVASSTPSVVKHGQKRLVAYEKEIGAHYVDVKL